YYAALKVKGVPVKLLQFNEEFHGTGSKPSNYIRIRTPRENEAKVGHISSSLKIRDCASRACQLEDMQAGVRAIDDVDMASVGHEVASGLRPRGRGVVVVLDTGSRGGTRPQLLVRELTELHPEHRERGVRACIGRQIDSGNLWVEEVRFGRFLRSVQELVAID